MFGLFKSDPVKKMKKKRSKLLADAVEVQRSGDLKAYAAMMKEADDLDKEIEALEKKQ
ncbi:Lacal_2735 family protein [Fulvivirga sp. RKSG066]|uniref:DUF6435 family protein n=1 Tax=Fulvivirga aurantia TaxID=2529383 RepID=UPI0012BCFB8C|nr:DUF6435 family protein [Fulvivirga aurantia]MTI22519.1 Lacal_2735 family protein [Fulvivirga aurantia]